jgi:hypothetical protein
MEFYFEHEVAGVTVEDFQCLDCGSWFSVACLAKHPRYKDDLMVMFTTSKLHGLFTENGQFDYRCGAHYCPVCKYAHQLMCLVDAGTHRIVRTAGNVRPVKYHDRDFDNPQRAKAHKLAVQWATQQIAAPSVWAPKVHEDKDASTHKA